MPTAYIMIIMTHEQFAVHFDLEQYVCTQNALEHLFSKLLTVTCYSL